MGPGSICTTQGTLGIGRAQGSAVYQTTRLSGAVIADGGIRQPGDMLKALALGADFIMVGRYIAGCDETPSPTVVHNGQQFKLYRGMGSIGAMRARGGGRYGRDQDTVLVAQGTDDQLVPQAGALDKVLQETLAALRLGLRQLGCASVAELHQAVSNGEIRFERRSEAAKREGNLHDLLPVPGR
jgi:IMP dehydrogenase